MFWSFFSLDLQIFFLLGKQIRKIDGDKFGNHKYKFQLKQKQKLNSHLV